ncbi:cytochrome b [Piscinibacter sp.]|jgi:cytochrome b561|uniref:cytochrome b n=1 Tax=Piscinibacter sp. TaxID=1903157 RepID=UPI002F41D8C3
MTARRRIENTTGSYGVVAALFHWVMAVLVIALAAVGLYMVSLPDAGFDTRKITLILYHKQFGVLALLLVGLRWSWRLANVIPELVDHLPDWQKVVARFVHLSFYGLMFALPFTGWLMSSAAGIPVTFFGLFTLPDLAPRDDSLFRGFVEIHKWLGYLIVLCIVVHVGAALRHHFVFRDDTLRRMWP